MSASFDHSTDFLRITDFVLHARELENLMGRKFGEQNIMAARKEQDQQDKKNEKAVELDFGMGKISFGGLFSGFGNIIDLVSKLEEEGADGLEREGEFTSPSGRVKAVYGLSVKTGPGRKPTVESFGNVKKTSRGPVIEEEREPLVDIFDEQDHILIIVELPGIEEKYIKTDIQGDILTLSASNGDRKYYKEVVLPEGAAPDTLKSKYKNGVLEIRIGKQ